MNKHIDKSFYIVYNLIVLNILRISDTHLSRRKQVEVFHSDIKWKFTKFLTDRNGGVAKCYAPTVTTETIDKDLIKLLEESIGNGIEHYNKIYLIAELLKRNIKKQ